MQIKEIDFSDGVFKSLFFDYCLKSKPLPRMMEGSLSRRVSFIREYENELRLDSEFKFACLDEDEQPLLYSFFSLSKEKDYVAMDFICPNIKMVSTSSIGNIIKYQAAFCESFLRIYEETGLALVRSDLIRISKRQSLIKTLKRFVPPFVFIKNEKGEICSVEVKKKNVISFYEKVKSKSDRN